MIFKAASKKVDVDGIAVGGTQDSVAIDHTHVGHKRKYGRGRVRGEAIVVIGATSRDSKLWNFNIVHNERIPCTEHHVNQMVENESHLRTDKGGGLSTIGTLQGKNFAGHSTVNHSGKKYKHFLIILTHTIR